MKVSTNLPFKLVYSLFEHEYLGYIFESFVVQTDEQGRETLQFQNISAKNATEFSSVMDEDDLQLIKLIDSLQQNEIVRYFSKGKMKAADFFAKHYADFKKKDNPLRKENTIIPEVFKYLERRRSKILDMLPGKNLYVMGTDGYPCWRKVEISEHKASVLFHFHKNEDNTHYYPTIKHYGKKVEWKPGEAYIVCYEPAWIVINHQLFSFEKNVDGHKLKPFLSKKFIMVPAKMEEEYFSKFVAPLMASFDVRAYGMQVKDEIYPAESRILVTELATNTQSMVLDLFNQNGIATQDQQEYREADFLLELAFNYGNYTYKNSAFSKRSVNFEKSNGQYIFKRIDRDLDYEKDIHDWFRGRELKLKNHKIVLKKSEALSWFSANVQALQEKNIRVEQNFNDRRKYFLGNSSISIEVNEKMDWFDIYAVVKFGEFEIPFLELRKIIRKKQKEILLPDGSIGLIPDNWIQDYGELFAFIEDSSKDSQKFILKKHHLALIQELRAQNLARVTMSKKLEALKNFEEIEDIDLPLGLKAELRPYQKAGYNWLHFLQKYRFGGCLADDMGLGKTIQTLALLQQIRETEKGLCSLIIMPTSLLYNWEEEAARFTPLLKTYTYTGTLRNKNVENFSQFDIVFTSYGVARLDIELLKEFNFHYIILDESQAIKNPSSNISKAVRELKSTHKLILTGTPLENSAMDLWAQMAFINPGLLGNQKFFVKEFLQPIEKQKDRNKTRKLFNIIKPFILRRHKSQVAKELPERIDNVHYTNMDADHEAYYEGLKNHYRDQILGEIDAHGLNKSKILILEGLIRLRQAANHPKLVDPNFQGSSSKMEDVMEMVESVISENSKVLVFSQFVKHLDLVRQQLDDQNIPYAYLDGSTRDRQAEVKKFQEDERIKIFLISIKAGGTGLNLTRAEYVFILDPWWNPAVEAQAIDRAHRIGQINTVFTYKFITKNTIEEKLLKLQEKKLKLYQDLIVTEEGFVKELNQQDIEDLLS